MGAAFLAMAGGSRIDRTAVDEKWNATKPSEVDDSFRTYFEKVKESLATGFHAPKLSFMESVSLI